MTQQPPYGGPQSGPQFQPPQPQVPSAGDQQMPPSAQATKPKSKTPAVVAGVVALGLIGGGGVVALNLFRGGASASAAKALPSSAGMVVELNLNPSIDQQAAVGKWVERFPTLAKDVKVDNYKEGLYNWLAGQNKDMPAWDKVEPWLGDSVAVAAISQDENSPAPVFAFATKNKSKAEEFFKAELDDDNEMAFVGDTMLVWEDNYDVSLNADAISKDPLANSAEYKKVMSEVPTNGLGTFFATDDLMLEAAEAQGNGEQVKTQFEELGDFAVAGALSATNDVITFELASTQSKTMAPGEDISGTVGDMDANSVGALGLSYSDKALSQVWDSIEELANSSESQVKLSELGITSADDFKALFGNQIGLSVLGIPASGSASSGTPEIAFRTKGGDPSRLENLIQNMGAGTEVDITTEGDSAYVGIGVTAEQAKSPSSKLKDLEAYKKAIGGDSGQAIAWVNVAKLKEELADANLPEELMEPLKAIGGAGMVSSADDQGKSKATFRVVAAN